MKASEAIRTSLGLLAQRDRRLLAASVALQMATSILDLIGVMLIGLVGAMSMAAVQGDQIPKSAAVAVSALGLAGRSRSETLAIIAAAAAMFLLAKSVLSPLIMARIMRFLARRQAIVSAGLTKELLSRPLPFVQRRSTQETAFALLQGANAATVGVLGQAVIAVSEATLLAVLAIALLVVDPWVALGSIVFFAIFSATLQRVLGYRAALFSKRNVGVDIFSLRTVQEALGAYREITVSDRRGLYVHRIRELRVQAAQASATLQVLALLPKYASEIALVVGGFTLAVVLFWTRPLELAAGTLAIFLATATRIMPSLLRLQAAALAIRSGTGLAIFTYELADDLGSSPANPIGTPPTGSDTPESRSPDREHRDFVPCIELDNVSFAYPGAARPALRGISVSVAAGQSVAFVGRSGAGKSTLADIILGVLQPDGGAVAIGGVAPGEAVRRWPGGIAYVPQEVMISNGTLRDNVALGLPRDQIDDDMVIEAMRKARLAEHLESQADGLDTEIGEGGLRLSGGQRQRLGVARALFSRPRLLVLDEATSALDAETEAAITEMLKEMGDGVTKVIIAHRLSTVRNAEVVVYLEDGGARAQGTFDEVCQLVPALQRQAELMGLR